MSRLSRGFFGSALSRWVMSLRSDSMVAKANPVSPIEKSFDRAAPNIKCIGTGISVNGTFRAANFSNAARALASQPVNGGNRSDCSMELLSLGTVGMSYWMGSDLQ